MRSALVLIGLLLVAGSLPATTVSGKATPSQSRLWVAELGDINSTAQVTVTLEWATRSAQLFTVIACEVGDDELQVFAIGAADGDRFQRVEAGLFGEYCAFGVGSFQGSSKFKLSIMDAGHPRVTAESAGDAGTGARGLGRLIELDAADWPAVAESIERLKARR